MRERVAGKNSREELQKRVRRKQAAGKSRGEKPQERAVGRNHREGLQGSELPELVARKGCKEMNRRKGLH